MVKTGNEFMQTSDSEFKFEERANLAVDGLEAWAVRRGSLPLWCDDEDVLTWQDFGHALAEARRRCVEAGVRSGQVVVTPGEARFESVVWLFAVASVGATAAPLRKERRTEVQNWTQFCEIRWIVDRDRLAVGPGGTQASKSVQLFEELERRAHPGLMLATGGTTGMAKVVLHDLAALLGTIRLRETAQRRILPLMRFDHIGGLDIVWRALAGGQLLVAPPSALTLESVAAVASRHRVEVMPATPTFLNLLLLSEVHLRHDLSALRTVPYGAEPMPAALLGRLQAALPGVQFIQRFGTSETGALPASGDGNGLLLRGETCGYEWRVVDGELWIKSPARALGYLGRADDGVFGEDGWFKTGDIAEQRSDGTVRVFGRKTELINVGGEKVLPAEIERVLHAHPNVADCRVYGEKNAIFGQVVAVDVVWRGEERDPVAVKRSLRENSKDSLGRHKLPTLVRLVPALEYTHNLKKVRAVAS